MSVDFSLPGSRPYGILSNYALTRVTYQNLVYPTTEHLYQALKFLPHNPGWAEHVRLARGPNTAKFLGGTGRGPTRGVPESARVLFRNTPPEYRQIRGDWEQIKDSVMLEIITLKVLQHPLRVGALLQGTGDLPIREVAPWDEYWGTGRDGNGRNQLGKTWMQVRQQFRK